MMKPTDKLIERIRANNQAVTQVNTEVASRVAKIQRPSPRILGEGSILNRKLTETVEYFGGVIVTA